MTMRPIKHTEAALRIYGGTDCLSHLEPELARMNASRAVILCGATMARSALLPCVADAAGARCVGVFAEVKAHSPWPSVLAAARELGERSADAIIVLGGGSAVITARAAAICLAEGDDLDAMCTRRNDDGTMASPRLTRPKIPLLICPTTPNTAYVKAGAGVFDPEAGKRKALFDPRTRAGSIFLHPDLLLSAPRDLVVSCCLDTLLLALEGLLSQRGDAISDAMLMHSLQLLLTGLDEPDSASARADLAMAGILSGRGTDFAPAGATTALGHAIGASGGFENGLAKAVLLPHVLRFNADYAPEGLRKITIAMQIPASADPLSEILARLDALFRGLGLPERLRQLGIAQDELAAIAGRAMEDWFILGNPRPVAGEQDLVPILTAAW